MSVAVQGSGGGVVVAGNDVTPILPHTAGGSQPGQQPTGKEVEACELSCRSWKPPQSCWVSSLS